jgi:hypothetical protein
VRIEFEELKEHASCVNAYEHVVVPIIQASASEADGWWGMGVSRTLERLVELYEAWGRPAEASEYRALLEG